MGVGLLASGFTGVFSLQYSMWSFLSIGLNIVVVLIYNDVGLLRQVCFLPFFLGVAANSLLMQESSVNNTPFVLLCSN